jgi:hypothetical protein
MHVLEEPAAFILRVEGSLKMEAGSSSDTLVSVYQSKYYHSHEDSNIQNQFFPPNILFM